MNYRNRIHPNILLAAAGLLLTCSAAWCVDYLMEGVDNSRTGWLQNDKSFSLQNAAA